MDFCEKVRKQTNDYWEVSISHPFVQGIADGTLPLEKFTFYLLQDSYYLKHYTKLLLLLAVKSNEEAYFLKTANFIREAELELHRTTFKKLNVTQKDIEHFEPAPAAYNYVSHMYQTYYTGTIAQTYAALLPCSWLYQEIGMSLREAKPNEELYQQWIDLYASADMIQTITKQKEMMNHFAKQPGTDEHQLMNQFKRSCYYEWQFWEMSWTLQDWKTGGICE